MSGRICLWRYREHTRNYPGFHLSADTKGCEQLLKLLGGLAKVRAPQIATVTLDPVTASVLAVPNNRDAAVSAFRYWDLIADPRFDPERFHFTVMNDRVRSELSSVQIESIAAGVSDIREGRGDYAIGDEDEQQLWFWWQTGD
jgi:hypothetical protein